MAPMSFTTTSNYRVLKAVELENTATGFMSMMASTLILAIGDYGYTPLKIGSLMEHNTSRAYDFYLDGYCDKGGICYDIYESYNEYKLCLAQTSDGINARVFMNTLEKTPEEMVQITKEKGTLFLTNLEIGLYRNKASRLSEAKKEKEFFEIQLKDL